MIDYLINVFVGLIIGVPLICLLHWLCGGFVHKPFWYKKRGNKEGGQ